MLWKYFHNRITSSDFEAGFRILSSLLVAVGVCINTSMVSSKSHKTVHGQWPANIAIITNIHNPSKQGPAVATSTGFLIGPHWYSWIHPWTKCMTTIKRIFSGPHTMEITWRLENMHMRIGVLLNICVCCSCQYNLEAHRAKTIFLYLIILSLDLNLGKI